MPALDQQFLAVTSSLSADRTFRWHVRRTHVAVTARRLAAAAPWIAVSVLALVLGSVVLTAAVANLQALGGR